MLTPIQRPNSTRTYLRGKGWIKWLAIRPPFGEAKDAKLKKIVVNIMAEIKANDLGRLLHCSNFYFAELLVFLV